jgi:hypothetical protein
MKRTTIILHDQNSPAMGLNGVCFTYTESVFLD